MANPMDMKKILQAMNGGSVKPVERSDDMKRFMRIMNEGANPHKVSLPVQMAMNHYSELVIQEQQTPSLLKKYFIEAEEAIQQEKVEQRSLIHQYAKIIAERVQMKESNHKPRKKSIKENTIPGHGMGFTGGIGPGLQSNEPMEDTNKPDVIKVDVPLLIRLLEYAREDAKTDMDLHNVTEKLISFSEQGDTLTMDNYDAIVGDQKLLTKHP